MKHTQMDRKNFLKWLGIFFMGLCTGRRSWKDLSRTTKKHSLKEAQFYKSSDQLAG